MPAATGISGTCRHILIYYFETCLEHPGKVRQGRFTFTIYPLFVPGIEFLVYFMLDLRADHLMISMEAV